MLVRTCRIVTIGCALRPLDPKGQMKEWMFVTTSRSVLFVAMWTFLGWHCKSLFTWWVECLIDDNRVFYNPTSHK